jgi:hypothetical protein
MQATLTPGYNTISSMYMCFLYYLSFQFNSKRACYVCGHTDKPTTHAYAVSHTPALTCLACTTICSKHTSISFCYPHHTSPLEPKRGAYHSPFSPFLLPTRLCTASWRVFTYTSERIQWAPHPLPSHPSPLKLACPTEKYLCRNTRPLVCIRGRGRVNCRAGGDGCRLIIGLLD